VNAPRSSCDVAFTPAVKAEQARRGSRRAYARLEERGGWPRSITPALREFLARVDTMFFATASADGRPYVQHRGGPKGFVKPLDDATLGFADFAGNRQYITVGNLAENDRAMMILVDFERRERIKIWGSARVVEDDAALVERLLTPGYPARAERAILLRVSAWDTNCPRHITARVPAPR
jgi:predicted pyridoxine 5'-phosphate oxidase superfamily flavin-nucleotide-binding protein